MLIIKRNNLSNFNTNNVTNMIGMFSGCFSLTELKISSFVTNDETNMNDMFFGYHDELKKLFNMINFINLD